MLTFLRTTPAYRSLLLSQALRQIALFASQLIVLYTAWTDGSPTAAGVIALLGALPSVVAPLFTGELSDRVGRRALLVWLSVGEVFALVLLAGSVSGEYRPVLLAGCATLLGVLGACHAPVFGAACVDVARETDRSRAAVATGLSYDIAKLPGSLLAGVGLATGRPEVALLVGAAVTAAATVQVWRNAPAVAPREVTSTQAPPVPWPLVLPAIVAVAGAMFLMGQLGLIRVALAAGTSVAVSMGVIGATFGVGAIAGSLVLSRSSHITTRHMGIGLAVNCVVFAPIVLAPQWSQGIVAGGVLACLYGFAMAYWFQAMRACTLPHVPAGARGRVAGVTSTAYHASGAAGAVVFGVLADIGGFRLAIAASIVNGALAAAVCLWASRRRDRSAAVLQPELSAASATSA